MHTDRSAYGMLPKDVDADPSCSILRIAEAYALLLVNATRAVDLSACTTKHTLQYLMD